MAVLCGTGTLVPFLHVSTGVKEHVFRKRDLDAFVGTLSGDAPLVGSPGKLCDVVSAGKLVLKLRQEGIEPAIGKYEAGQYFYRRADLARRQRPAA